MSKLSKQVELKKESKTVSKLEGLKRRNPNKVNYILQVEKKWEIYAFNRTEENLNTLIRSLKFVINKKAEFMERKWHLKRLSKADFVSVYYEELWKLCDNYNHYGDFYFYETFLLIIHNRGIDITRKLLTKQGEFEKNVNPLNDEAAEFIPDPAVDIEKDVINRDLIQKILSEKSLTELEINLLQAMYSNPRATRRELVDKLGLKHPQEVERLLRKIKRKTFYIYHGKV